jgi:HAD superfamily hydrolase (TIGR01549 family)
LTIKLTILYIRTSEAEYRVYRRIAKNQQGRLMRSTKKSSIKACAFDLGNTLINDTQLAKAATVDMCQWLFNKSLIQSKEAFLATFESVNHNTKKPFISHTYGEIGFFEETFEKLAIDAISAQDALKKYREILMQKIHPDKDIVDALQLLKKKNMRIALLSNESVERVDAYLEKTNLRYFFDTIVVSASLGIEKPDLRFFQEALNQLNIKGEEMAMFGDNEIADGAAKKLGIFFILVTGYMNTNWIWEKGNPYRPDYIMEKITQKDMQAFLNTGLLDR